MELVELMELSRSGKVALHSHPYPLEDAAAAFDDLANDRIRGRAVLVP